MGYNGSEHSTGHAMVTKKRPTVGFLNYNLWHSLECAIWYGVMDMAQDRGANLICFVGDQLRSPFGFQAQANVLYDLVDAGRVDGIVMFAAAIGVYLNQEEKTRFFKRYLPLPTVLLEEHISSIPCIDFDFAASLRELLVHLIELHGYRRIAFIRGPATHQVAELRHRVYIEVLLEYGIELDPDLVTPPGVWDPTTGREAIKTLVDERHVAMDAIVAASDDIAFGVLAALRERGILVPEDVAVVGHDDIVDSKWITPPLTTVPNRAYEEGRLAAEVLLAQIAGEKVSERITIPLAMVIRQSCGCIDPAVVQAAGNRGTAGQACDRDPAVKRAIILSEMRHAVGQPEIVIAWIASVLDAFSDELLGNSAGVFLGKLSEVLRRVAAVNGDVVSWQNVCSAMRRHILPCLTEEDIRSRAEDLWQQARVMIGETAQRVQGHQALQVERRVQVLREIEAKLISTFHVEELMDVLAAELPRLGIPACYVALYEDPAVPTGIAKLLMAYDTSGRIALPKAGQRYPACQILPEGMLSPDQPHNLVAYPLYFRTHQLGLVVFEVGPRVGTVYEALRAEISSALQGALLVQRLHERTAALIREQYILDTFMKNVPDEIYFKDLQGRITRANDAHARRIGFADPSEEIGKSDFDFFVEETARAKFEQEQQIIRTGIPVLDLEEQERWADGRVEWSLTSKMPLQDEHGEIVGTFGVSRDITRAKEVEARIRSLETEALEIQMAGGFAHEIRNALAGSSLALGSISDHGHTLGTMNLTLLEQAVALIHEHVPPERSAELLRILRLVGRNEKKLDTGIRLMEKAMVRALEVTDLISEYARLGRTEIGADRIDVYAAVEEIVQEHSDAFARQGIALCLSGAAIGELVGHRAHFRSILNNLVLNARDALLDVVDDRERRIDLRVWEEQKTQIVTVSDTANGIDPMHLSNVFKPFFSTKPTTGMGLGLSIVAKLVSLYQGEFELKSEVGKGTTFTLRFPLHE